MIIPAEIKSPPMERDMDLIRDLLTQIAADPKLDGRSGLIPDKQDNLGVVGVGRYSESQIAYHLNLLIESGFVKGQEVVNAMPMVSRLTWNGHEFLDNIRDPGIWEKTKERLKGLPGIALSVVAEIAMAEARRHLGLPGN